MAPPGASALQIRVNPFATDSGLVTLHRVAQAWAAVGNHSLESRVAAIDASIERARDSLTIARDQSAFGASTNQTPTPVVLDAALLGNARILSKASTIDLSGETATTNNSMIFLGSEARISPHHAVTYTTGPRQNFTGGGSAVDKSTNIIASCFGALGGNPEARGATATTCVAANGKR